jgi:stress response protein SCP2
MKGLMSDVLPGCEGGPGDNTAYLERDGLVDISNLATSPLGSVSVGVKWEASKKVDLELGCLMMTADHRYIGIVQSDAPRSEDGSVTLTGGDGSGQFTYHQSIKVNIENEDDQAAYMLFFVWESGGGRLEGVGSLSTYVSDAASRRDVAMLDCCDARAIGRATVVLTGLLMKVRSRWFCVNSSVFLTSGSLDELIQNGTKYLQNNPVVKDPFSQIKVSMAEHDEYRLDTSGMGSVQLEFGQQIVSTDFGVALVMFDRHGNLLDGVDARRPASRAGPAVRYHRAARDREEFSIDLGPRQEQVFCYFLVLTGSKDTSELRQVGKVSTRLLDGGGTEYCCWEADVYVESARSVVLARISKSAASPQVNTTTNA